jgi:hypothetical protein
MKIYKTLFQLAIKSRWIIIWSKFRRLFQSKYKNNTKLKKFLLNNKDHISYLKNIEAFTKALVWKADDYTHLWDSISLPHFVQHQLNLLEKGYPQEEKSLDCDDFSVYFANVICKKFDPKLLAVFYKEKDKFKFSGHMVCLLKSEQLGYCHISNWGLFTDFKGLDSVVKDIVKDREYVGHALYTKDLSFCKVKVFTDIK